MFAPAAVGASGTPSTDNADDPTPDTVSVEVTVHVEADGAVVVQLLALSPVHATDDTPGFEVSTVNCAESAELVEV